MEESFEYLSVELRKIIGIISKGACIHEIRLRVGKPLIVYTDKGELCVSAEGFAVPCNKGYIVPIKDIRETLEYVSNYSLYAYEEELKKGYITMTGGNRVGICGKVILDGERIKGIRNISSVNIRLAHEITGCAAEVMHYIYNGVEINSTLIASPPGGGKTTILRDIIRCLSDGTQNHSGISVGVADERSEIAACHMGVPQNNIGIRTDVLDGCPKALGMMMLIRSMSPKVVAVDEIGSSQDAAAIMYAINCGSRIIATIHGGSMEELLDKEVVKTLIASHAFTRIIMLGNSTRPGVVEGIYDGEGKIL